MKNKPGITTNKIKEINSSIESLKAVITLLELVKNDELSLTDVANQLDMTPQWINHELNKNFRYYISNKLNCISNVDLKKLRDNLELPETTILKYIFDIPDDQFPIIFPKYDSDKFWTLTKSILTEREFDILTKRLGYNNDKHTLVQLSKIYSLNKERIRQIQLHCLDKLRKHRNVFLDTVFLKTDIESYIKNLDSYYLAMNEFLLNI